MVRIARPVYPVAIFALALLCACGGPAPASKPAKPVVAAPKPPTPELASEIQAAMLKANGVAVDGGAAWRSIGAREVGGLLIERYALGDGPELVLARDPTSPAV